MTVGEQTAKIAEKLVARAIGEAGGDWDMAALSLASALGFVVGVRYDNTERALGKLLVAARATIDAVKEEGEKLAHED